MDTKELTINCDVCDREHFLFKIVWDEIKFFTRINDLEYKYTCKSCRRNIKIENILKNEVN